MRDLARRMLVEVVDEPPGCDLRICPRTLRYPHPQRVTGAALAEALQVHAANEPADRLREPWGEQNANSGARSFRRAWPASGRHVLASSVGQSGWPDAVAPPSSRVGYWIRT